LCHLYCFYCDRVELWQLKSLFFLNLSDLCPFLLFLFICVFLTVRFFSAFPVCKHKQSTMTEHFFSQKTNKTKLTKS
jgi:hypothetical protein